MTDTSTHTNVVRKAKRQRMMMIVGFIFLLLGLIWFLHWLIWGRFEVETDNAYVSGNQVQLMSQVPGTVIEINADDTQLVMAGQTLVTLDPTDMQIALERAKTSLATTVRQVKQAFERAQQMQQTLILRNADLMKAQQDLRRRVGLVGERAISREEIAHYRTAQNGALAQYNFALHDLQATLALVTNTSVYTNPQVENAKTNLKAAFLNLVRTTIVAPVTGYVAKRHVQLGQQVNLNTPMLAIIPLDEVWVDANYKETQLSYLRINQPVTLTADAYPDFTYHGKIVGLNPGTGAAFALLPPQNATGNWIKIVQRLAVRIGLDKEELKKYPLQLGLSMHAIANIYDSSGKRLETIANTRTRFRTKVYDAQLANVDVMINKILHDNAQDLTLPPLILPSGNKT